MTKKLFVGGLSWGTDDAQLKAAFGKYGTVAEARVILDRDTGRSRGFGFVTFEDDDAGTRAIQEMDGVDIDGRPVRVNEAQERPRPPRDGGGGSYGGGSGGGRPAGAGRPAGGARPAGGRATSAGGSRPAFRSEDRPAANSPRGKRRGRPGEGKGEDRFARRRNAQQGRSDVRGQGGFVDRDDGDGDVDGDGYGYDE